ncbi:MAG: hypothetical protein HY554_08550 [Elusimicrobia bacterium]|nr:hypothetical protein [Elusimicrobiota bacterium]
MGKNLLLLALAASAAAPAAASTLRVQGTLVDRSARPLTGLARLDFRLVDSAGRGEVWDEIQEVKVVRGAFLATLGQERGLPPPGALRPSWRLAAVAPLDSGWTVGPLREPDDLERRSQLDRLLRRLGSEPRPAPVPVPAEYRRLLAPRPGRLWPLGFAAQGRDGCLPGAGDCPRALQRVLQSEERLLRSRLETAARQDRLPPDPRVFIGVTTR